MKLRRSFLSVVLLPLMLVAAPATAAERVPPAEPLTNRPNAIVIPNVDFQQTDIRQAMTTLQKASMVHDPAHKGVKMIIRPGPTIVATTFVDLPKVTFRASDISVAGVAKMLAEISSMECTIAENEIELSAIPLPSGSLSDYPYYYVINGFMDGTSSNEMAELDSRSLFLGGRATRSSSVLYISDAGRTLSSGMTNHWFRFVQAERFVCTASANPPAHCAIADKLDNITILEIQYRGAAVSDMVDVLQRCCSGVETDKTDMRFVVRPGKYNGIDCKLRNVTVLETLSALCTLAGAGYSISGTTVTISEATAATEVMATHPGDPEREKQILKTLESITIPEIEFRQANLFDVVDELLKNTVFESDRNSFMNAVVSPGFCTTTTVTLKARNVTLLQALKTTCELGGAKFSMNGSIITITPAPLAKQ